MVYKDLQELSDELQTVLCDIMRETVSLAQTEPAVLQLVLQVIAAEER